MDKNIADQLNKAYEAFRQACMDRDSAVKELKQKTDSYEKQISEQKEKITFLTNITAKLKSQLAANRDHPSGTKVTVPEDSETRRNGTLPNLDCDQLREKLKLAMQREKLLKEQLESESVKLKQTEDENNLKEKKFEAIITIKEDEIRHLKKQLKEINEAQNFMQVPRYEKEARNEKPSSSRQDLSPGPFGAAVYERDELESVFWSMKEEFYRIRTLAKSQTDQLSKFNIRREPATEIPFSKPIQCTDEQADDVCSPWVKRGITTDVPHFTSITVREIGQDEEENSVESLSKLNVKFPPTENDTTFLESTTDAPPIPCIPGAEALLQVNRDLADQDVNFSEMKCNLFEELGPHSATPAVHNPASTNITKASAQANAHVQTPVDKTSCFKVPFLYSYGNTAFPKQDDAEMNFPALETNEVTPGSPQQPHWKPYHSEDSDLLTFASENPELNQSEICEFCQKVFPPSLTSKEDFLRHLNSHFN
ncbi:TRAF family member-associated NF-kappa-B activator [Anolis carolinensis]|uniref:TRAF family member-associated NF-kappa-B activator n=1 Tax=Anolis carolinensis TaxID=28377 RepID=UPI002F2B762B